MILLTKYTGIKYSLKFITEDGRVGFLNGQFACMNDQSTREQIISARICLGATD